MSQHDAARWRWIPPDSPPQPNAIALQRRGTDHGFLLEDGRRELWGPVEGWAAGKPLHLAEHLPPFEAATRQDISRTQQMFERLREEEDFSTQLWQRIPKDSKLEIDGATIDVGDEREIEKVHASFEDGPSDLFAKLSWVSNHLEDASLRVRFSFGSEGLDDWESDPVRARGADRFAELAFPECQLLAHDSLIDSLLTRLCGTQTRLSERILYSNAPGGGARFHHDAESQQMGVAYAQLDGRTAWLALPGEELVEQLKLMALPESWRQRLESEAVTLLHQDADGLDEWLNEDPQLTRLLVEAGWLFVLEARDVLLLPSLSSERTVWHSVFALGEQPSLSLSFGIFSQD